MNCEDFKGWPLNVWPTFKRPFLKLEDRHFFFDLHSLFDHLYRQLEKKAFAYSNDMKQEWIEIRKRTSESLPALYLLNLLPGAKDYGEVYYKWKTGRSKKLNWCETDRLIIFDDTLFIVEVKAGSFTWTSPDMNFDAFLSSLKNLVEAPSLQGSRFVDYLNSAKEVSIFNEQHQEIRKISRSDFNKIVKCSVTLDPFTEFAAQSSHLKKLNIEGVGTDTWTFSIDDLRVYSDIFANSMEFLHFTEQRIESLRSPLLQLDDELDHLGLYLKHNNYSQHADEFGLDAGDHLSFHGYRSDIDKYFSNKLVGKVDVDPLSQSMPSRLRELISKLAESDCPGRAATARYILNMDGEWRDKLFGSLDFELASASEKLRTRPLSSHGDVRVTIYPWKIPVAIRQVNKAIEHTMALMVLNDEADRLLIEPIYSSFDQLLSLNWKKVLREDIPKNKMKYFIDMGENLRKSRINDARLKLGKIKPNVPCPCGSGKKYKYCCKHNN